MRRWINRVIRGVVALAAFWFAAHEYAQAGLNATAVFAGLIGVAFAWMAASGKG